MGKSRHECAPQTEWEIVEWANRRKKSETEQLLTKLPKWREPFASESRAHTHITHRNYERNGGVSARASRQAGKRERKLARNTTCTLSKRVKMCDSELITGHVNVILIFDCNNWDLYVNIRRNVDRHYEVWRGSGSGACDTTTIYSDYFKFSARSFTHSFRHSHRGTVSHKSA